MVRESKLEKWSLPNAASEVLCSNLLQGVHAAAQPLPPLGYTDRLSAGELLELAASSVREVERLRTFFGYMQ
jgi:hypothetical protein